MSLISEIAGTPIYTLRLNGHDLVVDGSKRDNPARL